MKKSIFLFLLFILFAGSCQSLKTTKKLATQNKLLYQKSIENSMSPSPDKIYDNLISITPQNNDLIWKNMNGVNYVLVVSWVQDISNYEKYLDSAYYNTGAYPIWVTTAPELLERMKKERTKDVNLRLNQLLGLPPNSDYNYFVEFWVEPKNLFRPCPDNEITDNKCNLCFPENTDSAYISWVNNNRINSYYQCELFQNYPWTQLGYTYDWNPKNRTHIGLSEFVIGTNKNVIIEAIYTTTEYLNKNY